MLGALAVAPTCVATEAHAAPLEAPVISIEKLFLENGLRVLLETDRRTPNVAVRVRYDAGSQNDPPGKAALAHLVEHLMFRGSQHVKDGEHVERLSRLGATALNATTRQTSTTYEETVPARALETALWLESDRMGFLAGGLTEANFLTERQVLENEAAERTSLRPYGAVSAEIARALHGTGGSIRQIQFEDVSTFLQDWYRPNNATITLVGNFDREEAKRWIETYFGPILSGTLPTPPHHHNYWDTRGPIRLEAGVPIAQAFVGWPLNSDSPEDAADEFLTRSALRAFLSAQLFEEGGPVSRLSVVDGTPDLFLAAQGTEGATADELAQYLQDAVKRFRVTSEDFHAARRAALTDFLSSLETIEDRSNRYSEWRHSGNATGLAQSVFASVNASSAARMDAWFDPLRHRPPVIIYVTPKLGAPIAGRRVADEGAR